MVDKMGSWSIFLSSLLPMTISLQTLGSLPCVTCDYLKTQFLAHSLNMLDWKRNAKNQILSAVNPRWTKHIWMQTLQEQCCTWSILHNARPFQTYVHHCFIMEMKVLSHLMREFQVSREYAKLIHVYSQLVYRWNLWGWLINILVIAISVSSMLEKENHGTTLMELSNI